MASELLEATLRNVKDRNAQVAPLWIPFALQ
jgi:hypothetical protein